MSLGDKTVLERIVERIAAARHSGQIVVATTTTEEDDAIATLCEREGIACFRGHPADLLDRHYQTGKAYGAEIVVKIPSDCPLIDPAIIDRVLQEYCAHAEECDYASNLHPATYPDGNDVEVFSMSALERAWHEAQKDFEREHTTPYFWEHPEKFRLHNVSWDIALNYAMTYRWTLDYPEDYAFIRTVFEELSEEEPYFGFIDIIALLHRKPHLKKINEKFAGVNWYRHHLHELRTVDAEETKMLEE